MSSRTPHLTGSAAREHADNLLIPPWLMKKVRRTRIRTTWKFRFMPRHAAAVGRITLIFFFCDSHSFPFPLFYARYFRPQDASWKRRLPEEFLFFSTFPLYFESLLLLRRACGR